MSDEPELSFADYALRRRPDRIYLHASFQLRLPTSRDFGEWARYVVTVFDEPEGWIERADASSEFEWEEEVVYETPGGRRQIKFQIAREAGRIRQIEVERIRVVGGVPEIEQVLRLDRHGARRLIDVVAALQHVPVEEGQHTVRIDDQTLRDFFDDPDAIARLYERDPERMRALIESDASADDVIALAHRREAVRRFRKLLADDDAFAAAQREAGGPERVWQRFLEANPWILGVSLAGQLLMSWNPARLEQVVAGASISGPGKRVDALLETSGRIRALVFAEIKHHRTELLGSSEYRSGCWPPSGELSGAVTQAQQTVDIAVREIGAQLRDIDKEGMETGEAVQVVRPRSFVIAGQLDQMRSGLGVHTAKYRSFELYRRNLYEPEIVTFDELLARAEWHISLAEQAHRPSV